MYNVRHLLLNCSFILRSWLRLKPSKQGQSLLCQIYGAWMISRHIFNLQTGQIGFCKMAIAQKNLNWEHCEGSSKMPKKWVAKIQFFFNPFFCQSIFWAIAILQNPICPVENVTAYHPSIISCVPHPKNFVHLSKFC